MDGSGVCVTHVLSMTIFFRGGTLVRFAQLFAVQLHRPMSSFSSAAFFGHSISGTSLHSDQVQSFHHGCGSMWILQALLLGSCCRSSGLPVDRCPLRTARRLELPNMALIVEYAKETVDPFPRDPNTFSEGDWRHCYVGVEGPITF